MNYYSATPPYRPVRVAHNQTPPFSMQNHVGPAPAPPEGLPVIMPTPGRQWRVGPSVGYEGIAAPLAGLGYLGSAFSPRKVGTKARVYYGVVGLLAFGAQVAAAYYGYQWGVKRGIGVGTAVAGFLVGGAPVWLVGTLATPLVFASDIDDIMSET